jgi:hypothetical protein
VTVTARRRKLLGEVLIESGANPSLEVQNASVVLRFDPLALTPFGNGIAILSWQQLH